MDEVSWFEWKENERKKKKMKKKKRKKKKNNRRGNFNKCRPTWSNLCGLRVYRK